MGVAWRTAAVLVSTIGILASQACLVEIRDLRPGAGGAGGAAEGGSTPRGIGGHGASGGGNAGSCPDDMIHVADPDNPLVDFCIDAYETTKREHDIFLLEVMAGDVTPAQPSPQCDGNLELRQEGDFCPDKVNDPDLAVNCVDWCDAYAYCAYRGKRLCGALPGGGAVVAPGDPYPGGQTDEWEYACSEGGRRRVPYLQGNEAASADDICTCHFPRHWEPCHPDADASECVSCPGPSGSHNSPGPSDGYPDCEGGYAGLFNMVGNVSEWTDRCEGDGPDDDCMVRGGSIGWGGTHTYDHCQQKQRRLPRQDDLPTNDNAQWRFHLGIRCCSDAN